MVVVIICIKTSKLAAVLWPGVLPAAVETLRLGSGHSVPAGAAHGAAAPLLAPRPFKLPGLPPSPPTHGKPLSQLSLRPRHPSIPPPWSVGCGCHSLQGGSPLLITDAKVIRSSRCVYRSIPVFFKNIQKTNEWLPRYPLPGASVSVLPCSKLFQTGVAL